MDIQLTHVTLGVSDLKRSTKFYTDLGCEIANDYGVSVFFKPGDGSSFFGLYGRDELAADELHQKGIRRWQGGAHNNGIMRADKQIKLTPERSVDRSEVAHTRPDDPR